MTVPPEELAAWPAGSFPELEDLPGLTAAACAEVAARIREFLVETVGRTGGHLGANLGCVELTLALYRAFRQPPTTIIWDTGHQTYAHKILTGRAGRFETLRCRHGLAGFPDRRESPHDLLSNSHASMGPAWAYGAAMASGLPTVVVIGDGALTGGVAFEALNAIGYGKAPVIVVLNDNGRSYAPTASRLTAGEPVQSPAGHPEGARGYFTSLGLRYHGPVDGHDLDALDSAFRLAAGGSLPCAIHVRTQKGYRWQPALADEVKRLHDIPARMLAGGSSRPGWSHLVGGQLCELAAGDDRVHAITAAMPDTVGLGVFQARFPGRYHDLGIAEQACVGVAAGLASRGLRPFFAVVTTFLTRALDQILNDVALHALPVVFLLDRAGITGPDGPSHHGVYDIGLLRNVPGIEIYSPSTVEEVAAVLRDSLRRDHGPLVVRYPKGGPAGRAIEGPAPGQHAGLLREGRDACLVAHGSTVATALETADLLRAEHGVRCGIWRLSKVHPLDPALVRYAVQQDLVIPIEEVSGPSGLAQVLAGELLARHRAAPLIRPLTLPAGFLPHGDRADLLEEYGMTPRLAAIHVLTSISGAAR